MMELCIIYFELLEIGLDLGYNRYIKYFCGMNDF